MQAPSSPTSGALPTSRKANQLVRIFIIGVNGFIGNGLANAILTDRDWEIVGIDIEHDRLSEELLASNRFTFYHGDIGISREWVEFQIKRCDVVLPLAAVAIPKIYIDDPLHVFELDFKENLRIIELASKYKTRIVFPSSSEVYGMCGDDTFDEETSPYVLGPLNRHRWIYSCSKQLLDRVIHAHGLQRDLQYTLFRPFNWIGPRLDRIEERKVGNSRVITQFMGDIAFNRPLHLVDGGMQRRCFLYLDDGIDALLRILDNVDGLADRQIFNVGNPQNDLSIQQLAELVIELYQAHPYSKERPFDAGTRVVKSEEYYGRGYQDISSRRPSIERAEKLLGWKPRYGIRDATARTLDGFVRDLRRFA